MPATKKPNNVISSGVCVKSFVSGTLTGLYKFPHLQKQVDCLHMKLIEK